MQLWEGGRPSPSGLTGAPRGCRMGSHAVLQANCAAALTLLALTEEEQRRIIAAGALRELIRLALLPPVRTATRWESAVSGNRP